MRNHPVIRSLLMLGRGPPMRGPNDFWLTYNHLIESYKAEGPTPDIRCEHIAAQFRSMPSSVKQHVLDDMHEFLTFLVDLHAAVRPATDSHRAHADGDKSLSRQRRH